MTKSTARIAIATAFTATLACASLSGGGAAAPLEGPQWTLALLDGAPARASSPTRAPYIRFLADGNRTEGTGGCNRMSGSYRREGEQLTFGPMISTKMACAENELNAQEQHLMSALSETRRFTINRDTLRLFDGGASPRAVLVVAR